MQAAGWPRRKGRILVSREFLSVDGYESCAKVRLVVRTSSTRQFGQIASALLLASTLPAMPGVVRIPARSAESI